MVATQTNRLIKVSTPLGPDVLLFHRMNGTERISRLFEYEVEFLSTNGSISLDDILGQNICVELLLANEAKRYFNGYVSRFSQHGTLGEYFCYRAVVRPWLWFLTRTSNCRIFQNMSVPNICKQVFSDKGFTDVDDKLTESYPDLVFCVQYRETDFNFVSRLLEQYGIAYYFKHEEDKHTLVLADSISAYESVSDYDEIPYYPLEDNVERRERDHIYEWNLSQTVQSGGYVLNDHDFEKPKASLISKSTNPKNYAHANYEQYDYPGEYTESADGDKWVYNRMEELHTHSHYGDGGGNVRGLTTGKLFKLENYPRPDQNKEYLVGSTSYRLQSDAFFSSGDDAGDDCRCAFQAIDSQQPFKPQRSTLKPIVQGPQTAVVVGPAGDEIYTNEHGQVKLQFHWDREGQMDENSSCWIRVSQVHAGKGFGGIDTPRIGEEVIVEFLEGDPDRPIVTGRVYNGDNKAPNGLPAAAMISGMKTNSTPGGGGDNTIMLDDTKGNELIRIHGQYDMDSTIDNDLREHVLNDRSRDVTNNETISVGVDKTVSVGSNHTESIGSNQSITVGSNKTETVTINKAETIGVAKELTIGGLYAVTVGAAMNEAIGAAKAEEIGGLKSVNVGVSSSENIGTNKSVNAGANISETAGKNISVKAGSNISESAGKDVSVSSGKKMSFSASDDYSVNGKKKGVITLADELTIKVGKATINMKKNGDITINGKNISAKGSGNITLKAKKIIEN